MSCQFAIPRKSLSAKASPWARRVGADIGEAARVRCEPAPLLEKDPHEFRLGQSGLLVSRRSPDWFGPSFPSSRNFHRNYMEFSQKFRSSRNFREKFTKIS